MLRCVGPSASQGRFPGQCEIRPREAQACAKGCGTPPGRRSRAAEALVPVNTQLAFPVAPSGGVLCEELFEDAVEQRDGLALFVLGER